MLYRLSALWARAEIALAALLAALVTVLILVNVATRSARMAIYWIDEAAIYAMIWMTFLAASAAVHERSAVAVTLIPDMLSPRSRARLTAMLDLVALGFGLAIAWFCWIWFDPAGFAAAGFDVEAFQGATFNFIYAEPTTTLGIRKAWVWLIMLIFSFGFVLHALANLSRSLPVALKGGEEASTGDTA